MTNRPRERYNEPTPTDIVGRAEGSNINMAEITPLPKLEAFGITCQTQMYVFEPGDGDSHLVWARVLVGAEAKRFNASPGDIMIFTQYGRGELSVRIFTTMFGADIYRDDVLKWASSYSGRENGGDRQSIVLHHIAAYVNGSNPYYPTLTPSQMGWKTTWTDMLADFVQECYLLHKAANCQAFPVSDTTVTS